MLVRLPTWHRLGTWEERTSSEELLLLDWLVVMSMWYFLGWIVEFCGRAQPTVISAIPRHMVLGGLRKVTNMSQEAASLRGSHLCSGLNSCPDFLNDGQGPGMCKPSSWCLTQEKASKDTWVVGRLSPGMGQRDKWTRSSLSTWISLYINRRPSISTTWFIPPNCGSSK